MNTLNPNTTLYVLGSFARAAGAASLFDRLRALGINVRHGQELDTLASVNGALAVGNTGNNPHTFERVAIAQEHGMAVFYNHQLLRECERLEAAARGQRSREIRQLWLRGLLGSSRHAHALHRCPI
jgi:hypothetical protein